MSRLRRSPTPLDGGFTLIELMIAAALMSLIGILVTTTMIGGLRVTARGEKRVDDVGRAQHGLLLMTADLRASRGFLDATPTKLRFFTSTSGAATGTPGDAPERVTYEVTPAGNLLQTREQGTGPLTAAWTPTATSPVITLVGNVLQPAAAGRAVFTLLSVTDSMRQCTTGPTVSTLGSTVTGALNLAAIYAVDIWLSVNSAAQLGSPAVTFPAGAVVAGGADLKLDAAYLPTAGIGQGC